ncbi:MAG TPA: hypothetical protein VFP55_13015 [Solirubrobacteraceae bacterium]|nr:hypothetical protein [Solirubrobacteraceae bacterium]
MGFAWIDLILKIPLVLVILIVWWVIRHEKPEPPASDDDGGIRRGRGRLHPLRPFPRSPRRGPHGDPPPPPPSRVRVVTARARSLRH